MFTKATLYGCSIVRDGVEVAPPQRVSLHETIGGERLGNIVLSPRVLAPERHEVLVMAVTGFPPVRVRVTRVSRHEEAGLTIMGFEVLEGT